MVLVEPTTCPEELTREELIMLVHELRGRRGLVWDERATRDAPAVLVAEPALSVGCAENPVVLLEGDNLAALDVLARTHAREVDVIYLDPPYNTGARDFRYTDSFGSVRDDYRHSAWLDLMLPRLERARALLRDTGVLIISIDDNEQAHLRLLCDRIFGEDQYLGDVIRATNSTKSHDRFLSINYDHTLVYTRDRAALERHIKQRGTKWQVPKNNVVEFQRQVRLLRERGLRGAELTAELKELTKYPRFMDFVNYWYADERGVYMKDNMGGVRAGSATPLVNPLTGEDDPIPPGGWRYRDSELARLTAEDRIHFHTDGSLPRVKRYLDEHTMQRPKAIMSDDQRPDANLLESMGIEFDHPKQLAFMERLLSIFDADATIVDLFAGSGTTGHAVANLNARDGGARRAILVTDDENRICRDVAHARLRQLFAGYVDRRALRRRGASNAADEPRVAPVAGGVRFFRVESRVGNLSAKQRAVESQLRDWRFAEWIPADTRAHVTS